MEARVDHQGDLIGTTLRGVWPSLPALLAGSVGVCAAAVVPVIVAPGVNPIALLVAAVVVTPMAAALVAIVNDLAFGEVATIARWWHVLGQLWRLAIGVGLLVAVPGCLLLAAIEVVVTTRTPLMWPSLVLTATATVIALLAAMAALPLGAAHGDLRGRRLLLASVYVVSRHPTRFLACASALGCGVWAATTWSASLLLLVPAPAAIVAVTATWTSAPEELTRR